MAENEPQAPVQDPIDKRLARHLSEILRSRGLTAEKLAAQAGLHKSFLYRVLKAEKQASLQTLEKLAKALNLRVKDLFPDD